MKKTLSFIPILLMSIGFLAQDYWQQQISYKMHIDFDHVSLQAEINIVYSPLI